MHKKLSKTERDKLLKAIRPFKKAALARAAELAAEKNKRSTPEPIPTPTMTRV